MSVILKNDMIGCKVKRISYADQSMDVVVVSNISSSTYRKIGEGDDVAVCAGEFLVVAQGSMARALFA